MDSPTLPHPPIAVDTDDGVRLAVHPLRPGTPGAAPLLLVHALAMDASMWIRLAAELRTPAAIYALDCRGHGASAPAPAPYDTARIARDVGQVLDALGVKRAHVAGCSMGGTIALACAARLPGRLASVMAIDATAWYGPQGATAWEGRAAQAQLSGLAALVDLHVERWFSPAFAQAHPGIVEQTAATFLRTGAASYAAACRMLGAADERAGLAAYRGAAAFVVGADDQATPPAMSQQAAALIPGATVSVLDGCRHYSPIEAPAEVARCVEALLARAGTD